MNRRVDSRLVDDKELLEQIKLEAEALVAEARDQAQRLKMAASSVRGKADASKFSVATKSDLMQNIETTIAELSKVLDDLNKIEE